jgi:hypothetical protein
MHEKWRTYTGATEGQVLGAQHNTAEYMPLKLRKAKAAFVILSRNSEMESVLGSLRQIEARFNWKFGYPYVFLNEEPFSDEFKKSIPLRRHYFLCLLLTLIQFLLYVGSQQRPYQLKLLMASFHMITGSSLNG